MRTAALVMLLICLELTASGCSTWRNFYNKRVEEQENYKDEFSSVGTEGRADMPREKESDGLTPLLQSPEARSIEKSLGYD